MDLARLIRAVPDFPLPGVLFRDLAPLLASPEAMREVVARFARLFGGEGIDRVAVVESRGFLFGAPLALALGAGLVAVRKKGRLPGATLGEDYALEYGTNRIEVQADAFTPGQRVLVVDDVLATGGTLAATHRLIARTGATVVAAAVVVELLGLAGREAWGKTPLHSLVHLPA